MSDIRTVLSESLAPAQWEWLRPHAVAGRMVVVSQDLNLVDVGEAIAADSTPQVQDWLERGLLAVADQGEIDRRDRKPGRTETPALIVQPFVLVPELEADA